MTPGRERRLLARVSNTYALATPAEKVAYQRGYQAGARKAWPPHRPPVPPEDVISTMMAASWALRDGLDAFIAATYDRNDPTDTPVQRLDALIDRLDQAHAALTAWLLKPPE